MQFKKQFQSFVFPLHDESTFLKEPESIFVGRSTLRVKMIGALRQTENSGGCFLVGGYRGVGKNLLLK